MKFTQNINPDDNGIKVDLDYSHELSEYEIFECNYYNLDTFLKALITFPINRNVFRNPASIEKNFDFFGTASFEEAWNLCRFTQDEGYEKFVHGLNSLRFKRSETLKKKESYNVVGHSPNVSKLLSGNPCNMKIRRNQIKRSKITVYVECSYSAFTEKNQVINRGICIINLIEYLEKQGFDVCFQLQSTLVNNLQMIKINVPIKREEERLNVKLSYFPLVNPAFLRRLIFRAIETIQGLNPSWASGYGYPYKKSDEEIMAMDNTIYISTPTEMGIDGFNLEEDFKNFVDYIDHKYNLEEMMKGDEEKCHKKIYGSKV